jgi:hypothetical protein
MKHYTIEGESRFTIDGVMVFSDIEDMTEAEARLYLERAITEASGEIVRLDVNYADGDAGMVDVKYTCRKIKFERIRRITGYLVGTIDRWNDAKQSEEQDRVKHIGGHKQ